jgi:hypothetical protein
MSGPRRIGRRDQGRCGDGAAAPWFDKNAGMLKAGNNWRLRNMGSAVVDSSWSMIRWMKRARQWGSFRLRLYIAKAGCRFAGVGTRRKPPHNLQTEPYNPRMAWRPTHHSGQGGLLKIASLSGVHWGDTIVIGASSSMQSTVIVGLTEAAPGRTGGAQS